MTRWRGAAGAEASRKLSSWRLPAGDVLFEKVGVLQAGKLDGEAFLEVTHDASLDLAQRDQRADRRPLLGGDAGAGFRHVDDAAGEVDAVRHNQTAHRVARHDTAVPAVFRKTEDVAIGKPGELRGQLVALARGCRNRHGKAVLKQPRDAAFQPAEM